MKKKLLSPVIVSDTEHSMASYLLPVYIYQIDHYQRGIINNRAKSTNTVMFYAHNKHYFNGSN